MHAVLVNSALVGVGGFVGCVARYLTTLVLQPLTPAIPAGTLAANLLGCFLIGMLAQCSLAQAQLSPEARLLLATGFCGGFTTMSSMIYETARYLKSGAHLQAGIYVLATLIGSLLLFVAGSLIARWLFKTSGGIWG